jgi:hypothetical protein
MREARDAQPRVTFLCPPHDDPEGVPPAAEKEGRFPTQEMSMRTLVVTAALAASFALPLPEPASAQTYSSDVMTRCNQSVGQMKFEGWPGDRFREMMMSACQNHGGTIPGARPPEAQQQPAALQSGRAPQRPRDGR